MADPVTIGLLVASTAISAAGAISAGNAAAAQANAQNEAAKYNAVLKEQNAQLARQQSGAREDQLRRNQRQLFGQQRAALAQSGIGLGSGSALDLEEQSAVLAELDALTLRYEGELQAQGLLASAQQDYFQGQIMAQRGATERSASYMSAGASLLSGAANASYLSAGPRPSRMEGQVGRGESALSVNSGMGYSI